MRIKRLSLYLGATLPGLLALPSAYATNGMLMEGYGPESTAMGGTAMAFDHGAAAMVANPATLGLFKQGESRLDLSLGNLRPDVSTTVPIDQAGNTMKADSSGDSYLMPAGGWVTRNGAFAYGFGVFSQGGMGTEYDANSVMQGARSEVGVGAALIPISYSVNQQLSVATTLEYVWGGMDLIMGMPIGDLANPTAGTFADFANPNSGKLGSATGTLVQGLGSQPLPANAQAVFNFSNDDDFSGKANGAGYGARFGVLYQLSPVLSVGGAYQTKTAMDDWEGSGSMAIVMPNNGPGSMTIPGTFKIKDFQFPATFTLGMAYQLNQWLLAADISQIMWSDSMDKFNMTFTADASVPNFGGASADITMKQEWDDQTVLKLGAAYTVNPQLTLRGGLNLANNPVPDAYLNPLFPAIIENHYTAGFTYAFNSNHSIGASLAIAPEVKQTNSQTGVQATHAQTNLQFLYSFRY